MEVYEPVIEVSRNAPGVSDARFDQKAFPADAQHWLYLRLTWYWTSVQYNPTLCSRLEL